MSTAMTAEEALRRLMEPMAPATNALLELAGALDKGGPLLRGGASPSLVADVLQVHEVDTWARTTRTAPPSRDPFQPFARTPRDGTLYRSFIPTDLSAEHESQLRELASQSRNVLVQARVFHVLWVRFSQFVDAKAACEARFALAELLLTEGVWTDIVSNLGHLIALLLQVRATVEVTRVLDILDRSAQRLIDSDRPFAFPVLADLVGNTLLSKKPGRDVFTKERGDNWAEKLDRVATMYAKDPHHGHDALVVLQNWHGRWNSPEARHLAQRRVVEQLLELALVRQDTASWLVQQALQHALNFGLADLTERCRVQLMRSIKESVGHFKAISGRFQVPAEALDQLEPIISGRLGPATALRELAILPGLLEIDRERLTADAKEMLSEHPMLLFINSAQYHREGKVTFQATEPEGNLQRQIATSVGFHLIMIEAVLQHVLHRLFPSFTPTTLIEALAEWPHLPAGRRSLLGIAAERFAAQDWTSSGFIVTILYEALLRDLLRAGGYSALKLEPGGAVQMDETLNSLLRSTQVRQVLGDQHCDVIEFVLCDARLGWNLRNDVAHGTVPPDALSPTRVLMVWLLLIRLTCYVAPGSRSTENSVPAAPGPPAAPAPPAPPDATDTSNDAESSS